MKQLVISILLLCFFAFPRAVLAVEQITDFQSAVLINQNGTIDVVETITYDLGTDARHGIYRDIPRVKTNQDGQRYQLDFVLVDVMQDGAEAKYSTNTTGDVFQIKIGDANRTITGIHEYLISYTAMGAISYFSDHDELYWNATGNRWNVPIENSELRIQNEEFLKEAKLICYTGVAGSTEQNCEVDGTTVSSTTSLSPGEGLTVAVSFPRNLVAVVEPRKYGELTAREKLIAKILFVAGILYYLGLPLLVILYWFKTGRDPSTNAQGMSLKAVSAWFEAPKDKEGRVLFPAQVGTLVDESADFSDITATIVHLATRHFLKINEVKKKGIVSKAVFELELVRDDYPTDATLLPFEKDLLTALFKNGPTRKTNTQSVNLYNDIEKIKNTLYENVVSLGFFPHNPSTRRTIFFILGFVVLFTGNFLLAVTLFVFAKFMPRKTLLGAQKKTEALGLRNFLGSQKRQLKFQVEKGFMFEKLLPYAIVFGVEEIWAQRFEHLRLAPPEWYSGGSGAFNTVYFANSMSNLNTSMRSGFGTSPTRSSSGFSSGFSGGSSGGGGGGGGGGSW